MNTIFRSKFILIILTFIILLITLYFGLRLKGFRLENHAACLQDETGIHFKRFGIAYAQINIPERFSSLKDFTLEIALKADRKKTYGFDLIMSIHNGKDQGQLIIGQWQSHMIIMNGDDYSHKRNIKRISAELFDKPGKKMILTITTGEKGTDLFINGKLFKHNPDLVLKLPVNGKSLLTLGNSVYGNHSWNGNIYGVAFYNHKLPAETIEKHCNTWKMIKSFSKFRDENPLILFDFDEERGLDSDSTILNVPVYFPVLKKRVLSAPWIGIGNFRDVTVNLLGFIPLGFILYTLLSNLIDMPQKKFMLFTVLACFLISLFIEVAQVWIPSRSSQSLDLILNTAGGSIGACISGWTIKILNDKTIRQD